VIVVAVVPLNFAVLVPCGEPKLVPVIVTDAPTAPEVGDNVVMLGAAFAKGTIRKNQGRKRQTTALFPKGCIPQTSCLT